MSKETLEILLNDEVIAIDQDKRGKQGKRIAQQGGKEIWMRELEDRQSRAVVLLNTNEHPTRVNVSWKQVGLTGQARVRDLWLHKDLGTHSDYFTATVSPHGVVMIKATQA